jgi:hypothetical protein
VSLPLRRMVDARSSMAYYREGQVQRRVQNHRVRKPTCTGRQGHERRRHRDVPSQKRTHARSSMALDDSFILFIQLLAVTNLQ